jgi:chorismate mutase/prephenate dehydratase
MTKKTPLDRLRDDLRRKDLDIVKRLNERARLSVEVGHIKTSEGREIYDPSQESKIYEHLRDVNEGPLTDEALRNIFGEILSSSRALQGPTRVAYLGPEASFTHLAAVFNFGRSSEFSPASSISGVFSYVEGKKADWGVVPVENSLEGSVKLTLDRLISTPLSIRAEVYSRISHSLLSLCGDVAAVRRVYSHPQALAQCQGWLRAHLGRCALLETESTAGAARRVRDDREGAAIGSALAAEVYGLRVLAEGIEDHPLNTTRFLVIGRGAGEATGRDKTSILFGTPHVPGALHAALEPFARENLNLMRIESHPIRDRMWEYLFFVDLSGHAGEQKIAKCLKDMEKVTTFIKVLGSYPLGEAP